MAAFDLIRELLEIPRENGAKRLVLGVYESPNSGRYLALHEQIKSGESWTSNKRGITVRRGELEAVITALQSASFDAARDNKNLSNSDYATTLDWS